AGLAPALVKLAPALAGLAPALVELALALVPQNDKHIYFAKKRWEAVGAGLGQAQPLRSQQPSAHFPQTQPLQKSVAAPFSRMYSRSLETVMHLEGPVHASPLLSADVPRCPSELHHVGIRCAQHQNDSILVPPMRLPDRPCARYQQHTSVGDYQEQRFP